MLLGSLLVCSSNPTLPDPQPRDFQKGWCPRARYSFGHALSLPYRKSTQHFARKCGCKTVRSWGQTIATFCTKCGCKTRTPDRPILCGYENKCTNCGFALEGQTPSGWQALLLPLTNISHIMLNINGPTSAPFCTNCSSGQCLHRVHFVPIVVLPGPCNWYIL